MSSSLSQQQILQGAYDEANQAIQVEVISGGATGAATAANQVLEIAALDSIDGKIVAVDTGAVVVSSSALPTGASTEATLLALSNKSAGALVSEDFDYQSIAYVGATTDISSIVYKVGGSGGTTVATVTLGYDGSNRLTSITKT